MSARAAGMNATPGVAAAPPASAVLERCGALPWWNAAREIASILREVGCPHYYIGGTIRDAVRAVVCGESTAASAGDLDIVVEQDVFPVVAAAVNRSRVLAGAAVRRHPAFLTMTVVLPSGVRIDLARARSERYPRPGALPVVTPGTVAEDIRRRDFTINAVGVRWDPVTRRHEVLDPSGGVGDIRRRLLRVFHPASFRDDPTRVLRAARFAATLGYSVERGTLRALRAAVHAGCMRTISTARAVNEFLALLRKGANLRTAALLLRRWGVAACFGQAGPAAALFIRHAASLEFTGTEPAERYRCRLLALAARLAAQDGLRQADAVRRLLAWCGVPHAERAELFAAARALDDGGAHPHRWFARYCAVQGVRPIPPLIEGSAVLEMGCPPGPRVGKILSVVRRRQEQGDLRTPAEARRFVARLLRTGKK